MKNINIKSYAQIIKTDIPKILDNLAIFIKNDQTILEFIKNEEELDNLLKIQKELIYKYLIDFDSNIIDEENCKQFYKDLRIPYTIVYRSLNTLKTELLKTLNKQHLDKISIFNFSLYFQSFINITAKVYLKKDIHSLKKITTSPFSKYLLFSSHTSWLNKIIQCISKDDIELFPLVNSKECPFSKYIYYPESLMICIDKNLCMYLEDLHNLIHKTANAFYLFYKQQKFSEAYFLFKDLKEQILKFSKFLSELYFITQSDIENSFFKLPTFLQKTQTIYLTMIDIKNLKTLNATYGESNITKALKVIENRIKNFIEDKQDKTLLIAGITSNFYMLNIKYSNKEYKELIEKISKLVTLPITINETSISFESFFIGFKIKKYSDFKEDEFVKILSWMKNQAKKQDINKLLYTNKEHAVKIENFLNEKYNEKFIIDKLNKQDVDIVFQPIYNSKTREIYTLEVLGRIIDENKLIPAGVFIDKIYDMNLIEKFDMIILDRLIAQEKQIKQITNQIFINISFPSLLSKNYMNKLKKLFKTFDIKIVLELTEQKFVQNIELIKKIHKNYKISFAVDDFGSGYSSLKSVVELVKEGVLEILKIDGTLIQNIENDEYMKKIIKIIASMGQELNLKTVAEYVENEATLNTISDFGITFSQGYYLSKPYPITELIVKKVGIEDF